ncbi:uncharacterized protein AAEQ78_010189 [Lycaon pictus]
MTRRGRRAGRGAQGAARRREGGGSLSASGLAEQRAHRRAAGPTRPPAAIGRGSRTPSPRRPSPAVARTRAPPVGSEGASRGGVDASRAEWRRGSPSRRGSARRPWEAGGGRGRPGEAAAAVGVLGRPMEAREDSRGPRPRSPGRCESRGRGAPGPPGVRPFPTQAGTWKQNSWERPRSVY